MRLRDVAGEAQLVICSGSDSLHGMALAGVPVLGLPMNAEQRISADQVAGTGAGRWLLPGSSEQTLLGTIRHMLDTPTYRACAQALKASQPQPPIEDLLAPVVAACARLMQDEIVPGG